MIAKKTIRRPLLACAIFAAAMTAAAAVDGRPRPATVPMRLDHNRVVVELELKRPDGAWQKARAWVDTGGTALIVSEPLARELGVDLAGMPAGNGQTFATQALVPALRLGGVPLDVEAMTVSVRSGKFILPGIVAECVLPPRCLRRLHVVLDYPAAELTVAAPGTLAPRGTAVPCRVNPDTGLFMVEATMAGETVALGVDTGSAGTWVSDRLTSPWRARHRRWPHAVGAAGSTNFFGFPFEAKGELVSLPGLAIGAVTLDREVAVLGLDQGIFDWYSQKSAAAVVGFLGAEAIARFRLEIDFPGQQTWWQPGKAPAARDLDIVPLSLRPDRDGSFFVAGVVERDGRRLLAGVEPGDRLLKVGSLDVTGLPLGKVIAALRGRPGARRLLLLERAGRPLTIAASVVRLP
jgi:hypothetical protein